MNNYFSNLVSLCLWSRCYWNNWYQIVSVICFPQGNIVIEIVGCVWAHDTWFLECCSVYRQKRNLKKETTRTNGMSLMLYSTYLSNINRNRLANEKCNLTPCENRSGQIQCQATTPRQSAFSKSRNFSGSQSGLTYNDSSIKICRHKLAYRKS